MGLKRSADGGHVVLEEPYRAPTAEEERALRKEAAAKRAVELDAHREAGLVATQVLYAYVNTCICICICICIFIYVYIYIYKYTYTYAYTYACIHICIQHLRGNKPSLAVSVELDCAFGGGLFAQRALLLGCRRAVRLLQHHVPAVGRPLQPQPLPLFRPALHLRSRPAAAAAAQA